MVLFPIYSRGLNQPFYIIFNCSCSEFHPLIYLSVVPPVFFSQTHPLSRLADKFLMLVGRCIPRDTRRYGIAFPPISFYILLSRLFGRADCCIENPEPAECTLFCVSGSSIIDISR